MSLGPVIAVVGPSGVGKDSVMRALSARQPGYRVVRRVITRPAAKSEDFEPVSEARFEQMQLEGAFALHWRAHGLLYGVPARIERIREGARGVLVNLSRGVLGEAQARFGDMITVSLSASPDILARRLESRGREDDADRSRRLARAASPLPTGLARVIELDNSGTLDATVTTLLDRLQPESA